MIRTVIADDSVSYRTQIRAALAEVSGVEVLQACANGKILLHYLQDHPADLLILDLEMPEMDGLETLKQLNARNLKVKTLVFSSASRRGADLTMEALRLGATDFIPKPSPLGPAEDQAMSPAQRIRLALASRIEALFPSGQGSPPPAAGLTAAPFDWLSYRPEVLVIGSSTGGPNALERIFASLCAPLPFPVLIAQHMPPVFTAALAARISRLHGLACGEAQTGQALRSGVIYFAPGDFHLRLTGSRAKALCLLDQGPKIHSVRPAVDPLFETAARLFGERCLGMVLTGMGMDGRDGARAIKEAGGRVIIQEEKSCVVFGMPGAVRAVGAFDGISTPDEIAALLLRFTSIPVPQPRSAS